MALLQPRDLIRLVRQKSPYYRKLYASLPKNAGLSDLPVLDQEEFWKANGLTGNKVLTGPMRGGIAFKSGGTTGNPKFSVFTKEEWRALNEDFGAKIGAGIIRPGDRVVNMFYVGQLYGSFLFITKSFEESPVDVLQLPLGGSADFAEALRTIEDFAADVLAGVPTIILNLAEYIRVHARNPRRVRIKTIFFGGEPFYPDQRERLSGIFPGVKIHSIGYASTDAGLLGYADQTCGPGEHRSFGRRNVLEILEEGTSRPIHEPGREGLLVVTDLARTLMPVVRYPVGDRGLWVEPREIADRKFRLTGRSEESARIGTIKLYVQDVRDALGAFRKRLSIKDFQLVVVHRKKLDGLIVRIAAGPNAGKLKSHEKAITAEIHRARPFYEECVRNALVHPIEIEWVGIDALEINPRTGKMRRVIDQRLNGRRSD